MKNNFISVIMPVYNSEKYLMQSIESILAQTIRDFEFIIIDDGSTDSSLDIIMNYKRKDDKIVVISRKNKGLVYSLNEGISISKGKYIARMDADDVSFPMRLEKQLEFLKTHENVDILGTQVNIIGDISENERLKYDKMLNIPFLDGHVREALLNYWYCFAHSSVMFRKEIFTKLKGYKDYRAEDLDLWLRALKTGFKIYKLNEKLVEYRIHKNSKTNYENKQYEGLKDGIRIKLFDVFNDCSLKRLNYLVWGASNGGKISKEIISQMMPTSKCIGFIDKFKTGDFEGENIYKPHEIINIDFDYIFIATEPGREQAILKLKSIGMDSIKQFLCTV
ncbi:glycosyltransferase family 2 protein [Clostridium oryzae]|uniref:Putative glycosyltransferase EpsE n=1 Tax=Clostridium oryzae TaxID=1450648 RepID=A0A1V4I4N7_9CLOT|nr:glycosyltransferase [Clostridium oryzae]OPJ54844.1 putative glycosyltransferase EpsE [Clostridium oryzae]